jgi:DNA-binding Xre family transcriptional regulator
MMMMFTQKDYNEGVTNSNLYTINADQPKRVNIQIIKDMCAYNDACMYGYILLFRDFENT